MFAEAKLNRGLPRSGRASSFALLATLEPFSDWGSRFRVDVTLKMENHMENQMEDELEPGG